LASTQRCGGANRQPSATEVNCCPAQIGVLAQNLSSNKLRTPGGANSLTSDEKKFKSLLTGRLSKLPFAAKILPRGSMA